MMDANNHIAKGFSEDLLDLFCCKSWFFDLSWYMLHVDNGNVDELIKAVRSFSFFKEETEEANYCRYLIEFSARKLRDGPYPYSCAPEYVDYINT